MKKRFAKTCNKVPLPRPRVQSNSTINRIAGPMFATPWGPNNCFHALLHNGSKNVKTVVFILQRGVREQRVVACNFSKGLYSSICHHVVALHYDCVLPWCGHGFGLNSLAPSV
jgi:hypothetical protein